MSSICQQEEVVVRAAQTLSPAPLSASGTFLFSFFSLPLFEQLKKNKVEKGLRDIFLPCALPLFFILLKINKERVLFMYSLYLSLYLLFITNKADVSFHSFSVSTPLQVPSLVLFPPRST